MIDVYGSSKGIAYCHFLQNLVAGWCLPYSLVILLAVPFYPPPPPSCSYR
jgi:hypothetical protein